MALGSAVHHGLASYHSELQLGRQSSTGDIHDAFIAAWQVSEEERPIQYRDDETKSDLVEVGISLLDAYLNEPPPENILAVEKSMIVPLWTSRGYVLEKPLVAVVDLLCDGDERLKLTEFKTSKRKYGAFEAESALQASCYAQAIKEKFDRPVQLRYTILVKTKSPSVQHIDTARTDEDLNRLGDIVQAIDRAIQREAFYPVESAMNCSGCPFRQPCREWQGQNNIDSNRFQKPKRELAPC